MYRKSSKGNPYHDARGRFARKDSMDMVETKDEMGNVSKKPNASVPDDRKAVMWASYGEQVSLKNKTEKQVQNIDKKKTDSHRADGKRFYHNQSITREKHAQSLSHLTIEKGLSPEERRKRVSDATVAFEKENKYAIKHGGKVKIFRKGNSNNVAFQIIESSRTVSDTHDKKNRGTVTRNTSTSMKQFSGYTVEYTKGNLVRSCKRDATYREEVDHISDFCSKHKDVLSDDHVCMKVWRAEGGRRLMYMASYKFDTKEEAEAYAAKCKGASIINHDDGSQD